MTQLSIVEQTYINRTGLASQYEPEEKLPVIVADNFPHLGTLTSLRFLEWVQAHPEGVVSLPTGKTPEFFIRETERFLRGWTNADTVRELSEWGIDTSVKPEMRGLTFVQIDEFYPIRPQHTNSFHYYVDKYYLEGFGLDPEKALLIDCTKIGLPRGAMLEAVWPDGTVDLSLRYRNPTNEHENLQKLVLDGVDQWCCEYESRIRDLGGIGFFLGGIGPDGHIGFNVRGSSLYSTTRLTPVNYETQAAAASDLGGIEVAKKRLVITIGLDTIRNNSGCAAIIMAAGEAKAEIVRQAITSTEHINTPASVLHNMENARFYLTRGAASRLTLRAQATMEQRPLTSEDSERIIVDLAIEHKKSIQMLTAPEVASSTTGSYICKESGVSAKDLVGQTIESVNRKLQSGIETKKNTKFLHTEPHHDDIMLGYLPFVVRHFREHSNSHHFVTLTSGFTSVTNAYMLGICRKMRASLKDDRFGFRNRMNAGYFDPENAHIKDRDVWTYLDGVTMKLAERMEEGLLRRFLRDLIEVYDERDLHNIEDRLEELENYFETQYPGKKDMPHIQKLKGMVREWESACLWGYFGWDSKSIDNLRLGFYQGDIFTEEPTVRRDVKPVLDLIRRVKPDVVTVALDPEGSGPDTHYKVLQTVAEALTTYREETGAEPEVIGYRNVWYRFHPSEANIYVPVSLNMLTLQESSFMNTYISQKDASFPSYEHDGPFPELARKIQVSQYEMLKRCLGQDFFYEHDSALIRATRGFVFLKSMDLDDFISHSRRLKQLAENR